MESVNLRVMRRLIDQDGITDTNAIGLARHLLWLQMGWHIQMDHQATEPKWCQIGKLRILSSEPTNPEHRVQHFYV